jgi:hypothetical protein
MGVLEDIMERYPSLAFLLGDPEIGPLLTAAVDPNQGFSPQTFQAKLYQTNWWRNTSSVGREWLIKSNTDPASANQERAAYRAALSTKAIRLGTHLSGAQLNWLTEVGLGQGIAIDDPRMLGELRKLMKPGGGKGDIGVAAQQVRALAEKTWYVRPSANSIYDTAGRIATGLDTIESANARFAAEAARRFPHLGSRIQGGETLADITAGYRQTIAEELELGSPEAVDPMRGEWRDLLGVRDDKTGDMRLMTEAEVIRRVRNRAEWWQTSHGRQTDAQATSSILRMFGKRG